METIKRFKNLSGRFLLGAIFISISSQAWSQTTIPAATNAGSFSATSPVGTTTYILNNGDIRSQNGSNDTVSFGAAATSGTYTLTINGLLLQTGTGRAIRTANVSAAGGHIFNLNVGSNGLVSAVGDDAVQARFSGAGSVVFNVNNLGTIYSGPNIGSAPSTAIATGQALDFASAVGGVVYNGSSVNSTALMRADGHDAVRLGNNMSLYNYGTILGNSVVNDSSANNSFNSPAGSVAENFSTSEGVSFEGGSGSSLQNFGLISGSRHGVESSETAANVSITNHAGGIIVGRNGSGIGFDATSASASNVVIVNDGEIRGDYAGAGNIIDRTGTASLTNDGDGDGIDIDGAVTITNSGLVHSTGAGGFDTNGRSNSAEGIAIGGGIITNNASGIIRGANRGILVNNDANLNRSALAATTITNAGLIEGQNGFGIRLEGNFNDSIINTGTITGTGAIPDPLSLVNRQNGMVDPANGTLDGTVYTAGSARFIRGDGSAIQTGEGNDLLDNSGTITGTNGLAVNLEGGDDTAIIRAGSHINGLVNGGSHTTGDILELHINGLTAEKQAALEAGETVVIGGMTFVNFEFISGASTSQSYEAMATSPTAKGVGAVLDNTQAGASANTLSLLDKVDTSTDANAALKQLTPDSLSGLSNININNASQTGQFLNQRVDVIRSGGPQFDVAGLRVWDPALARSLQQTKYWLADVGQAGQAMTDTGKTILPEPAPLDEKRWGFFLNGGVEIGSQGATELLPDSDYTTASVILGMDYRVTESFVLGVFGGYSHTDANLDAFGSESEINTGTGGIFGAYTSGNWFVNGALMYGKNFYANDRVALGTSNTGDTNGDQISFQTRTGYDFKVDDWTLTPLFGTQYSQVWIDGFTESGPAALSIADDEADSFRTNLGGRINYSWRTSWGRIIPEVRAAWYHEFLNDRRNVNASFVDAALPGTFSTPTANPDRDFGVFGTGISAVIGDSWTLTFDYDVEAGREEFIAHRINGGVRFAF